MNTCSAAGARAACASGLLGVVMAHRPCLRVAQPGQAAVRFAGADPQRSGGISAGGCAVCLAGSFLRAHDSTGLELVG